MFGKKKKEEEYRKIEMPTDFVQQAQPMQQYQPSQYQQPMQQMPQAQMPMMQIQQPNPYKAKLVELKQMLEAYLANLNQYIQTI